MTLRDLVSVVAATPLRVDLKARLVGYAVLWLLNGRGWHGLVRSRTTRAKLEAEFADLGVDITSLTER